MVEFVRGRDFSASALRLWVRRLSTDAPAARGAPTPEVSLLPVRRRSPKPPAAKPGAIATGIVIEVGDVRIHVDHGFDQMLLLEVLSALGGA